MSRLSICISFLQAANTVVANPNDTDQEHQETLVMLPSVSQTRNAFSNAVHYVVTVRNRHLTRLCNLFPEINQADLERILGNHIICKFVIEVS
jgi:hypothetical protein